MGTQMPAAMRSDARSQVLDTPQTIAFRRDRSSWMKCVLAGSRYFGPTAVEALGCVEGIEFVGVIVPAGDGRRILTGKAAGLPT